RDQLPPIVYQAHAGMRAPGQTEAVGGDVADRGEAEVQRLRKAARELRTPMAVADQADADHARPPTVGDMEILSAPTTPLQRPPPITLDPPPRAAIIRDYHDHGVAANPGRGNRFEK